MRHKLGLIVLAFLLTFAIIGCANNPLRSYKTETDHTITELKLGDLNQAKQSLNANNDVLYHLEYGSLLRMGMAYAQSESNFALANAYVDAWAASYHNGKWGNLSDNFEASLINDNVLDYQIKDYEKVMLVTYRALDALSQDNWDNARIEIKRMYELEELIQNYREAQYAQLENEEQKLPRNAPSFDQFVAQNQRDYDFTSISSPQVLALKNSYQSAFSHYLAGFVFEALGEDSLARPGYIKSLQLNPGSDLIKQSINNLDKGDKPGNNQTDLLLIEEIGHAPQLKSQTVNLPFISTLKNNTCINNIAIAFPSLEVDKLNRSANRFLVDSYNFTPQLFTNISLMAARYLHDNLPNVFIRNLLHAGIDLTAQQAACSNGSSLLNIAALGVSIALNRADERAWVLLPGQIYVARVRLRRGKHSISVNTLTGNKELNINLTRPYQIVSWRVIGDKVYFSSQAGN